MDAAERLSRALPAPAGPRRGHLAGAWNAGVDHGVVEGEGRPRHRPAAGVWDLADARHRGWPRRFPAAGGQHPGTDPARSRLPRSRPDRHHGRGGDGRALSHHHCRGPRRRGLYRPAGRRHGAGRDGRRAPGRHHHPARPARIHGAHPRRPVTAEATPGFSTRAIHAGQPPDEATGAVVVPIYQTSTFAQKGVGKHRGYEYSRTGNPTRAALEQCIAALEGGSHGLAFASGMAAEATIMQLLKPGDHTLAVDDLYGGTYRLFRRVLEPMGLSFSFVDGSNPKAVEQALTDRTRLVWLESPTNPLLKLVDIQAISSLAHTRQALVVVDKTFMSPYFQRPLSLGADIVVHSATKYLGGHSDLVGGTVVVSSADLLELPAAMTHASIPEEMRRAHGVADGLVRISVGIEDVADLISDLDRALAEA